jgi:hypothetical protein
MIVSKKMLRIIQNSIFMVHNPINNITLLIKNRLNYLLIKEMVNNSKVPLPAHPYHIVDQSP